MDTINMKIDKLCEVHSEQRLQRHCDDSIEEKMPAAVAQAQVNAKVIYALLIWSELSNPRKGDVCDSSALFELPDGSHFVPEVSFLPRGMIRSLFDYDSYLTSVHLQEQ